MFSDEDWLGSLRLPNCIFKETSQSLQLLFAISSDTLRVFSFVGKQDIQCRKKTQLD